MIFWVYAGLALIGLWLQLTVAPLISIFGGTPNLMLMMILMMALRWVEPWLFVYSAVTGLMLDVFSHGNLGLYGLSFFAITFITRYLAALLYENNILFTIAAVVAMSVLEGMFSLTLMEMIDESFYWWSWFFSRVIPVSLYHGLLAPLLLWGFVKLENLLKLGDTLRPRI